MDLLCPICKTKPRIYCDDSILYQGLKNAWSCCCDICGLGVKRCETEEIAIKIYNRVMNRWGFKTNIETTAK